MITPEGMSESEVLTIIDRVVDRLAYKYQFGYFSIDDMKQEGRMAAIKALPKYDGIRSFYNFTWTNVRNRLYNLRRDKFERLDDPCLSCGKDCPFANVKNSMECESHAGWFNRNNAKKNVVRPLELSEVNDEQEKNMRVSDSTIEDISQKEIMIKIDNKVPLKYREDWLRLKYGLRIPKSRREELQTCIEGILYGEE